jgi:hypothetical protein
MGGGSALRHALCKRLISSMRADLNILPQTVAFTPPLTLILGENGSGKTTIIEVRFPMISARHSANLLVRIVQGRTLGVPFPATSHVCYSHAGTTHGYVRCSSSQFRLVLGGTKLNWEEEQGMLLACFCDARAITKSIP